MLLKYGNTVYDTENDCQLDALIVEVLYDLNNKELVNIWNDYCEDNSYFEDQLFSMSDLEEYLEINAITAFDVITKNIIDSDCFCYQENWFKESTWGLQSSDSPWDLADIDSYEFKAYFEGLLLDDPEKYGCEEVDEESEE